MADPKNDTDFFWQSKYNSTVVDNKVVQMVDGSDALANHGRQVISFQHVPSGQEVFFKAFITSFNESYNCDWAVEPVFGRTDPIYLFKGNQRQISLNFQVPAASEGEAYENLGRVQKLIQFLYPAYHGVAGTLKNTLEAVAANTIAQSPLIKLKVMNLLASFDHFPGYSEGVHAASSEQDLYDGYTSDAAATYGALGAIQSLQVNHNLAEKGSLEKAPNTVLPKSIDITITFAVIHQKTIGWEFNNKGDMVPTSTAFPYGVYLKSDAETPDDEGKYFNERIAEIQKTEENRQLAQAVIDNAKARYMGMGGEGRLKRDLKKLGKGKSSEYETERLMAYAGTEGGWDEVVDILS